MTVVPGSMPLSTAGGVAVGADITIAGVTIGTDVAVATALGVGETTACDVSGDSMVITEVGAWGAAGPAVEVASATGGSVAGGVTAGATGCVAVAAGEGVAQAVAVVAAPGVPGMLVT